MPAELGGTAVRGVGTVRSRGLGTFLRIEALRARFVGAAPEAAAPATAPAAAAAAAYVQLVQAGAQEKAEGLDVVEGDYERVDKGGEAGASGEVSEEFISRHELCSAEAASSYLWFQG